METRVIIRKIRNMSARTISVPGLLLFQHDFLENKEDKRFKKKN